jgi:hypothetical protein
MAPCHDWWRWFSCSRMSLSGFRACLECGKIFLLPSFVSVKLSPWTMDYGVVRHACSASRPTQIFARVSCNLTSSAWIWYSAWSLGWKVMSESTVRWFVMRKKYCSLPMAYKQANRTIDTMCHCQPSSSSSKQCSDSAKEKMIHALPHLHCRPWSIT